MVSTDDVVARTGSAARVAVGRYGEDVAARALGDLGWEVLARNWRPHGADVRGEIDIVAADGDEAVVVEVKTRRGDGFGAPAEAVTALKVRRLRRLASAWLASQDRRFTGVRIDVVAVRVARAGRASIEHLRGVG